MVRLFARLQLENSHLPSSGSGSRLGSGNQEPYQAKVWQLGVGWPQYLACGLLGLLDLWSMYVSMICTSVRPSIWMIMNIRQTQKISFKVAASYDKLGSTSGYLVLILKRDTAKEPAWPPAEERLAKDFIWTLCAHICTYMVLPEKLHKIIGEGGLLQKLMWTLLRTHLATLTIWVQEELKLVLLPLLVKLQQTASRQSQLTNHMWLFETDIGKEIAYRQNVRNFNKTKPDLDQERFGEPRPWCTKLQIGLHLGDEKILFVRSAWEGLQVGLGWTVAHYCIPARPGKVCR